MTQKVVFAFCDHGRTETLPGKRKSVYPRDLLYEATLDGSSVRQLTGTARDPLKTWPDRATVMIEDNAP